MTVEEAEALLLEKQRVEAELRDRIIALELRIRGLEAALDHQIGTPCEQIRHKQQMDELEAENARLRARISAIVASAGRWTATTREHIYGSHADTGLCNCEIMVNRNAVEEARAALAGRSK